MNLFNNIELKTFIDGCPQGVDQLVISHFLRDERPHIIVLRDEARMTQFIQGMRFVLPQAEIYAVPAWDCLPYDRVSPHSSVTSARVASLSSLVAGRSDSSQKGGPQIVVTTVNGWLQKVPPPAFFTKASLSLTSGQQISLEKVTQFLVKNGFHRTDTVREYGEFAIRGGILDVFSDALSMPVRIDFFGDEIETIKQFDALSQRSTDNLSDLIIKPAAEFLLDEEAISSFRSRFREFFGGKGTQSPLYEAVSAGHMAPALEHWSAIFHPEMACLEDYCVSEDGTTAAVIFDEEAKAALAARLEQISEFYEARLAPDMQDEGAYFPLAPHWHYRTSDEVETKLADNRSHFLSSFSQDRPSHSAFDAKGRVGIGLTVKESGQKLAAIAQMMAEVNTDTIFIIAATSEGAARRIGEMMKDASGGRDIPHLSSLAEGLAHKISTAFWPLETGFQLQNLQVITEQDIFGTRLARPVGRRRADNFLTEVSSLEAGDLVVHVEHGIGRYEKLETISSDGSDHDCLMLTYHGGDKLYLPVENIDMLSRYGKDSTDVVLDKLGGVAWQARKAKIKERIKIMAEQLIRIAANRAVAKTQPLTASEGGFAEFCARFGFSETEDQLDAIADVLDDLSSGKATDRLICGDVGFGKTEVALRAAFVAAMAGYQVALVTPTTLLARQHGKVFTERFQGFPVSVSVLSRMTSSADAKQIKENISNGDAQIVIGTHALLAKSISFNNLGLLIVDEEQSFGVAQKERLKEMKGDIHVLTLTATPIPRTLQMALSGVRQMSIIATPPVDRLAVRTFIGPWDNVVLKEALLRERFRGGQSFVVCPRIDDMPRLYERIIKLVPDAKIISAHGRMSATELDKAMTAFGEGQAEILLSTNIVESGIDIPSANTMIIHRADMFGLSQLYQLRGRVGRSKQRAYAYLATDQYKVMTAGAKRRLEVMQTLDKLGAGFTLASHDLDIRGAGNLLGDEQSGHVKEVGVELYQDMLRQAVELAQKSRQKQAEEDSQDYAPLISIGTKVLIPEAYIPDLTSRLSIYRRIASLQTDDEMNAMMTELIDRFGTIPESVKNLLQIVELKQLCRRANILKIDAGDKGFSMMFKDNHFANPEALVAWIAGQKGQVQLKGDHKLVVMRDLKLVSARAGHAKKLLSELAEMAK
ncbi:MAG: transcription-repair coupling factor [Candidatus Puniceispirillaceae bacterium]